MSRARRAAIGSGARSVGAKSVCRVHRDLPRIRQRLTVGGDPPAFCFDASSVSRLRRKSDERDRNMPAEHNAPALRGEGNVDGYVAVVLATATVVVALAANVLVFAIDSVGVQHGVASERSRREDAGVVKTILGLQPFRQSESIRIRSSLGREGVATLVNLNPAINAWYLLSVAWQDGTPERAYHLENSKPHARRLVLDPQYPMGLVIQEDTHRYACDLFGSAPADRLEQGKNARLVYYPLCDSRIYLRNLAIGHRTSLEVVTEFFRDRVWRGEQVIGLGHQLMGEANRETGTLRTDAHTIAKARAERPGPRAALIDSKFADRMVTAPNLGISVEGAAGDDLAPGAWYAASTPGTYVSVFQPNFTTSQVLQTGKAVVNTLDRVEASALCYLMAFDLDQFSLGYARGTVHPGVGWSDHIPAQMKNAQLPGPDGIGDISPLVATGVVNPEQFRQTVATFTAGFKRAHGAFLYGDLALANHGSHYGFIENGVVFSTLQPGLATILVLDDGVVEMKTWEERDTRLLSRIRYARQNGVPIVEFDAASQTAVPGRLVGRWGAGNWSGSDDLKLRTMRSGVALQIRDGKRYLIYAVFSSATPSAMARVFQAYQCQYAMLLDMNALEHTYLAFYRGIGSQMTVEYLIKGMREVDTNASSKTPRVPRFVGYPDNRDFFFVMRRDDQEGAP